MAKRASTTKGARATKRSRSKKGTASTSKHGPRTKLTPKLRELLAEAIYRGLTVTRAAAQANIDRTTFNDWLEKGENNFSKTHRDFYEAIEAAKSRRYSEAVDTVQKSARGFTKVTVKRRFVPGGAEDGTDQVLQIEEITEEVVDLRAAFRVLESMEPTVWSPRLNAQVTQQPPKAYVDMPLDGEDAP